MLSGARAGVLPILDLQWASRISCLWTGHGEVSWESEKVPSSLPPSLAPFHKYLLSTHFVPLFQASVKFSVLPFFGGGWGLDFNNIHSLSFSHL